MNPPSESCLLSHDDLAWSMCAPDPISKCYIASEDHLQSLGLTMANGKPRFKVNEPCSSLAMSAICLPSTVEDSNSSQSFVVMSHPSIEEVQTQSLANYVQIQERTASIDYNSVISNMSPTEIEHKLSEMLYENVKLKETLAENNEAMKKQFNSLAVWQEEVASVHYNHKQKFAETRELINQLKKENMELKMRISVDQAGIDAFINEKTTESHSLQTSGTKFCNCLTREEELLKMLNDMKEELNLHKEIHEKVSREFIEFKAQSREKSESVNEFKENSKELAESKSSCKKATEELNKIRENSDEESKENYKKDEEELEAKCEKVTEILEKDVSCSNFMKLQLEQNSNSSEKSDSCSVEDFVTYRTLTNKQDVNDTSIQSSKCKKPIENATLPSEDRLQMIRDINSYSGEMEILDDYFSVQSSRYVWIQKCLKESAEILQNIATFSNETSKIADSTLITYINILNNFRKKLVNEQLENIADRQKLIKMQDYLQKIFSNYKSALFKLEIMQEENMKLMTKYDKETEEKFQQTKNLEKHLAEERKILEEEVKTINLEKLYISNEKKSLNELRESYLVNQEKYNTVLEKLEQERSSLNEEKTALDRQSKLYEAQEMALISEKKVLMEQCEGYSKKLMDMEQQLNKQNVQRYTEDLMVLRAQLEIYRADYLQEKVEKQELIREKNLLVEQIEVLIMQNQDMKKDVDRLREQCQLLQPLPTSSGTQHQEHVSASATQQLYLCPVCDHKFPEFGQLVKHVNDCVD